MKLKVSPTDTWAATIGDCPGGLAEKLDARVSLLGVADRLREDDPLLGAEVHGRGERRAVQVLYHRRQTLGSAVQIDILADVTGINAGIERTLVRVSAG